MTILMLAIFAIVEPTLAAEVPVCEPPPKKTVTVACEPHEGCQEKWIFVEPELPLS